MGAIAEMNDVAIMIIPSDPSTMRIRSRNAGRVKRAIIIARIRNMAVAMNMPRNRDFSFPNSFSMERYEISFRNVLANAAIGMARKLANCVSGITAPSSEGSTYLGTSHRPTNAFNTSAARQAQKSIMEYHQKSPSFAWSFVNIAVYYTMYIIAMCLVSVALKFWEDHAWFFAIIGCYEIENIRCFHSNRNIQGG